MVTRRRPEPIREGQRFGRLVVTNPGYRKGKHPAAEVRCDCGTVKAARIDHLRNGRTRSCGCLNSELSSVRYAELATRHGLGSHPLYKTWAHIVDRCDNPRCRAYRLYGGRGIQLAPEWHDVAVFVTWIEVNLGPRPDAMTLDRIDNDGDYEPGNVRWATKQQQALNRRPR